MSGGDQPIDRWFDHEFDYTIARGLTDSDLIHVLRDFFAEQPERSIEINRMELRSAISDEYNFTQADAESLFTGLVLNGVAEQKGGGRSFADYSFEIDCRPAACVLESQRIARAALDAFGDTREGSQVELTATFPPGVDGRGISEVRPLSSDIRQLFFDANSVVRIANPYFDPKPSVIGDIASLANRGVETRILTRETESASSNLASALNTVYEKVGPANRHRLKVRDLYEQEDESGRQAYATHAKIAIADNSVCYLGSANLTDTSLSNNFELGVLLRGEIVEDAVNVFETVFEFSREVDLPL